MVLLEAGNSLGLGDLQLDGSSLALCSDYYWPANLAELKLVLLGGAVFNDEEIVTADSLLPWLLDAKQTHRCKESGSVNSFENLATSLDIARNRLHLAISRRLRKKDAVAALIQNIFEDSPNGVLFECGRQNEQSLPEAA